MEPVTESAAEPAFREITVGSGDEARRIAMLERAGTGRGILFLGGYMSNMRGAKGDALDAYAAATGRPMTRFDYSGHGESGGRFEDGTISRWLEEASAVLDLAAGAPLILVGSSMGGWIALLLALAERASGRGRIAGLVLLAPATDMTHSLMLAQMDAAVRTELEENGVVRIASAYSEQPYLITRALIEDGARHLLADKPIAIGAPVHIIQGVLDEDVPFDHALDLMSHLAEDDVVLTLIKDAGHRLSRPEDLAKILSAVEAMS